MGHKIHIVIPVFSGWEQTRICLDALRSSSYRNLEVFIVDHGPSDQVREALAKEYPEVIRIPGEPKLWWAGATNLGVRAALARGATHIMLLNHDCYVEPQTIERLVAHIERTAGALVAPAQIDFFTRRVMGVTASTCFLLGFPTVVLPQSKYIGRSQLLPTKLILGGRGVIIPAGVFERIGLFDEVNLPSYYSDHDFYLRCRQRGIPLFVAPNAVVLIEDTNTSLAEQWQRLTFREFLKTLAVPKSHRNIRDLNALFKFHYPIKGFHHLGVALNVARYTALYAWKKMWRGHSR